MGGGQLPPPFYCLKLISLQYIFMSDYTFHVLEHPHNHFVRSLRSALSQSHEPITGRISIKPLGICVNDASGRTLAAICGWLEWGWLYIDILWVDESVRKEGIGHQLLHQLEQAALDQGIDRAYLDTGNFQAPVFYKKNGYEIFSEMDVTADNGKDYVKYSMRKKSIRQWRQNHP